VAWPARFFCFYFLLRTWNQNFFFRLRAGKFSSAAPIHINDLHIFSDIMQQYISSMGMQSPWQQQSMMPQMMQQGPPNYMMQQQQSMTMMPPMMPQGPPNYMMLQPNQQGPPPNYMMPQPNNYWCFPNGMMQQ